MNMFRQILFLLFCFSLLSCTGHWFSARVDVAMCGESRIRLIEGGGDKRKVRSTCVPPIAFYLSAEKKTVICRRGFPDNFTTPWDAQFAQRGDEDLVTVESETNTEEARSDTITHELSKGYWFKVFPVINNKSDYYLVVTELTFLVREEGGWKDADVSECGSSSNPYLYILDNSGGSTGSRNQGKFARGSYTSYDQFNKTFVQGNLAFYLQGLPEPPESDAVFGRRVPTYFIRWNMFGDFYTREGQQVGNFTKTGHFTTRGSSF